MCKISSTIDWLLTSLCAVHAVCVCVSRSMYVSHGLCICFTVYVRVSRSIHVSYGLCVGLTVYARVSWSMHVSHGLWFVSWSVSVSHGLCGWPAGGVLGGKPDAEAQTPGLHLRCLHHVWNHKHQADNRYVLTVIIIIVCTIHQTVSFLQTTVSVLGCRLTY